MLLWMVPLDANNDLRTHVICQQAKFVANRFYLGLTRLSLSLLASLGVAVLVASPRCLVGTWELKSR